MMTLSQRTDNLQQEDVKKTIAEFQRRNAVIVKCTNNKAFEEIKHLTNRSFVR